MSYKILDSSNIVDYLLSLSNIKNYFKDDQLSVKEIGDGNLNFVFLVSSNYDSSKQLIVKQAVPYLRCVGESYPLSKERMTYEIRSLLHFSSLSSHVPKIYYSDEEMSVVIMECLKEHIIMRKGMIDSIIYPNFSDHISSYLANTLFKTSSLYLSSDEKNELISQFIGNTELCKLTEDFVFSAPFMKHETNADIPELSDIADKLSNDVELKVNILELKDKFMNQSDALIHGDLHTGSIMINQDETFIIDSEFAFVGPIGFDIGALVANLVMSWVSHNIQDTDDKYKNWILDTIVTIWKLFNDKFLALWNESDESALFIKGYADSDILSSYQEKYMLKLLQESIGFAGCKIIRRQLGIAGVEDIRGIEDATKREKANRQAIEIGEIFIKKYKNIMDIEDIIKIIKAKNAR